MIDTLCSETRAWNERRDNTPSRIDQDRKTPRWPHYFFNGLLVESAATRRGLPGTISPESGW